MTTVQEPHSPIPQESLQPVTEALLVADAGVMVRKGVALFAQLKIY